MWVLTNIPFDSGDFISYNYGDYTFNLSGTDLENQLQTPHWFCDGHFKLTNDHVELEGYDFKQVYLENIYKRFSDDFIQKISGNYIIIKLDKDRFRIFSDRFGIKKFFYWKKGESFIISDSLPFVRSLCNDKPSKENIVLYSLMYHFIGGRTFFDSIYYNKPAEVIEYKDKSLLHSIYWAPESLLSLPKRNISISSIANAMSVIIKRNMSNIDIKRVSLSLTGGADTRNILAVFLANGLHPHIYTYGNPKSADCQKAVDITKGLGLLHSIHDINMDAAVFEKYARIIIKMFGGLASIHRAHRLIAIESEKQYSDYMFLGTLGGEFIRGVSEDDYIVPSIVFENWQKSNFSSDILKAYFSKKCLRYNDDIANYILHFFNREPYFQGSEVERKFKSLVYITAHLHDAQDINLYLTVMDDVFTPFLDIDYLELLFSSEYTFNRKELIDNHYLKRIENPVFAARFLKETYKPLLKFNYSGEHRPSEVILNKYLAAIMKVIRQKLRPKYLPNFSLDNWMEKFVKKNLPVCYDYNILKETFNLDLLMDRLANSEHLPKESYWITFTNPIMMRFIIEETNSCQ